MKKFLSIFIGAMFLAAAPAWADPGLDFDLPTDNGRVSGETLKGQVVYLDFWASWCAPCRKSFPWMSEIQNRYGQQGLTVVAINLDKDAELAKRFLMEQKPAFKIAFDPKGDTAQRFKVMGMPSSYLFDRSGKLVARHIGFRDEAKDKVEQDIRELLAAQPVSSPK